jgi:hypothetical protein
MKKILDSFWAWYERHYRLTLVVTTVLFALQVFHLYWLFTDVVLAKIFGHSFFHFPPIWGTVSTFLDYTEIPALISTTVLYIRHFRKEGKVKYLWFLVALNIQWLHLFWITDEIVVERLTSSATGFFHWSNYVSWVAIMIDYLELPVIYDTLKKTLAEIFKK